MNRKEQRRRAGIKRLAHQEQKLAEEVWVPRRRLVEYLGLTSRQYLHLLQAIKDNLLEPNHHYKSKVHKGRSRPHIEWNRFRMEMIIEWILTYYKGDQL